MGLNVADRCGLFFRPPLKPAGRKPFMADPKALAIIGEDFDGSPAFIAEDKQITAKRIFGQLNAAQTGQTVNAAPEINRFNSHQYAHMGGDLDHDCLLQNARVSS